jgi:hypothetical protein
MRASAARAATLLLGVAIRRCLQLLDYSKAPHDKLVDFEPPDAGLADRQLADREGSQGQGANRDGGNRQRSNRLRPDRSCPDADRPVMSEPCIGRSSLDEGDTCITFTR